MMGVLVGVAAGYVLGTKAGRGRYEQLARTYQRITSSPVTHRLTSAARDKVAEAVSTQPRLEPLEPMNHDGTVYGPRATRRG